MWYLSEIYVQSLLNIQSGGLGNTRVIHSLREFLLPIFHDTHTHMCARIMAHGILIKENSPPYKRQMCFSSVIEKVSSSLQHETLHHPSFPHQPMQYMQINLIFSEIKLVINYTLFPKKGESEIDWTKRCSQPGSTAVSFPSCSQSALWHV